MIATSDGDLYENTFDHEMGNKMPQEAPTEVTGASKSSGGSKVAPEAKSSPEPSGEASKLYIIRHGCTDMNGEGNTSADRIRGWSDVPLNDAGREDAVQAGEKLA